jgi:hypothetical protein
LPGTTTQGEFRLEPQGTGTRLTQTESGFSRLPPDLAAVKFCGKVGGRTIQTGRIAAHVDG